MHFQKQSKAGNRCLIVSEIKRQKAKIWQEGGTMGFAGIIIGITAIISGIILAGRFKNKLWYIMTAAGGILVLAGIAYVLLTLILINGIKNQPVIDMSISQAQAEAELTPELEENIVIAGADWRSYGVTGGVTQAGDRKADILKTADWAVADMAEI